MIALLRELKFMLVIIKLVSLSKMIEAYLDSVTKEKENKIAITPLVESLSGVIDLPADFDYKKEYHDYLEEKYK